VATWCACAARDCPGFAAGAAIFWCVYVPAKLAAADKKLLEELRKGEGLKPPRAARSLFERVRDAFGG
jgi:hypothetical protein